MRGIVVEGARIAAEGSQCKWSGWPVTLPGLSPLSVSINAEEYSLKPLPLGKFCRVARRKYTRFWS
jgi:hypothetical protein